MAPTATPMTVILCSVGQLLLATRSIAQLDPKTWAESISNTTAAYGRETSAPSLSTFERCTRGVDLPDSLALVSRSGSASVLIFAGVPSARAGSWYLLGAPESSDTLRARIVDPTCVNDVFYGVIIENGNYFLKISASDVPSTAEYRSLGRQFRNVVRVIGVAGHLEPSVIVKDCSCSGGIRSALPLLDSVRAAATITRQSDSIKRAERIARIRKKPWATSIKNLVIAEKIKLGMTRDQVRESWGNPEDRNRTVTRYSVREQWVYGSGTYVYFENGRVTAWQD